MMGQVIQLRQARPTPEDFKIVIDFMYWLERYVTQGIEIDGNDEEKELNQLEFVDRLERVHFNTSRGPNVYTSWERVLWGGQCAVDNAMDHSLSHLDFRPEIKAALELAAKVSAEADSGTARNYVHRWGFDDDTQEFMLALNDQSPSCLATIALKSDSVSMEATITIGPSAELRIPLLAREGEWISGRLTIDGKLVDTFGVRTAIVVCPHCSMRIDKPAN